MRIKISIILAALSFSMTVSSFAYETQDIPDSMVDYTNTSFDWQHKHWLINSFINSDMGHVIKVQSPFYSNDTEKFFFANGGDNTVAPDFFSEDGWVLWGENLGFDSSGSPNKHKDYAYPYVVLYNKVRGIARIISYINQPPSTFNNVEITLSNSSESTSRKANLFSAYNPIAVTDHKNYPASGSSLSRLYSHDRGQFVYVDMPITYDPCIMLAPYNLNIRINTIQNATIELAGISTSTSIPIVKGSEYFDESLLVSYLKDGNGLDIDNLGVLTFQNYSKIAKEMESERIAEAIYSSDGDDSMHTMLNHLGTGIEIANKGATMLGQPLASSMLQYASTGLNYFNAAPSVTLEGVRLPDPPGYLTYGEMALKGNSRVEGSSRTINIPLPGSGGEPSEVPGLFNLIEVPIAEVIDRSSSVKYSHLTDNGYTYKGARFTRFDNPYSKKTEIGGTYVSFNLKQLGAVVSPIVKDGGTKVLVGLESRLERTSLNDGLKISYDKYGDICNATYSNGKPNYSYCSEHQGELRHAVNSELVLFDQWEDTFGENTLTMGLPKSMFTPAYDAGYYLQEYRNFKLFLKVWLVPEHLMDEYEGDINDLDREALTSPVQMYSYPIKLRRSTIMELPIQIRSPLSQFAPDEGGFVMSEIDGRVKIKALDNTYKKQSNLRFDLSDTELKSMCPDK